MLDLNKPLPSRPEINVIMREARAQRSRELAASLRGGFRALSDTVSRLARDLPMHVKSPRWASRSALAAAGPALWATALIKVGGGF